MMEKLQAELAAMESDMATITAQATPRGDLEEVLRKLDELDALEEHVDDIVTEVTK